MKLRTFVLILVFLPLTCTSIFAQSVSDLLVHGKLFLEQNKSDSAIVCFEKVLELDGKNYDALVYLCNYHFLVGQSVLDKVETVFLAHESPTRMQVAQYNDDLIAIYKTYFSKAEKYLIQAYLIRRNDHLDSLAGRIADFKERIGMKSPGSSKSWLIKMILP